ncbi:hypothetical protein LC607_20300 [Nostoc sp. CHAB 5824]|nr:hypothetical protein [Nostoc sp. CHAB 5824]
MLNAVVFFITSNAVMSENSLLALHTNQNITLPWMGFTFLGGLIGLFIGIVLIKPLSYPLHNSLDFVSIQTGEFLFLLITIIPILVPILGIGIGVSVSQNIFLFQLGISKNIYWILFTSFAHFIPTTLYSGLFYVPTLLNFASQDSSLTRKRIEVGEKILVFIVWGSLIGLAQWLLIREQFSDSILWFFLSVMGISVGIFISNFLSLFLTIIFGRGSAVGSFYFASLMALLPYATLTGIFLEFLFKHSLKK